MKNYLLAVDDVPSILTVISTIFSDEFEVVKKTNGKEALEWMYSGNLPEIIITDLQMPGMNGFELIEEIKKSSLYKRVPIIVLSGQSNSSERVKCLKLGASDYLAKPFNPEELKLRATNILDLFASKVA